MVKEYTLLSNGRKFVGEYDDGKECNGETPDKNVNVKSQFFN